MPSVSKAQARLMAAAAHNPEFAKKAGVPVKVAKEFNQADKGRNFSKGGTMKNGMMKMGMKPMGKPTMKAGMDMAKDGMKKATPMAKPRMAAAPSDMGMGAAAMKKGGMCGGGMPKKMAKGGKVDGCAVKGKTKGKMV